MLSWDLHLRLEASRGKQLEISSGRGRGLLGASWCFGASWGFLGSGSKPEGARKQAKSRPEATQGPSGGNQGQADAKIGAGSEIRWFSSGFIVFEHQKVRIDRGFSMKSCSRPRLFKPSSGFPRVRMGLAALEALQRFGDLILP